MNKNFSSGMISHRQKIRQQFPIFNYCSCSQPTFKYRRIEGITASFLSLLTSGNNYCKKKKYFVQKWSGKYRQVKFSYVHKNFHLKGSTGAESSRKAAASKHSAASSTDSPPSSMQRSPRLYQAVWLDLSSRSASVRKLLAAAFEWFPYSLRWIAVEIKLGT